MKLTICVDGLPVRSSLREDNCEGNILENRNGIDGIVIMTDKVIFILRADGLVPWLLPQH
jgi:hypothetical protein